MNWFEKRRIIKEAKEALSLLFQQIIQNLETEEICIVYDDYSLKSKTARGIEYHDGRIDEFKGWFREAYGSNLYYELLDFYRSKLFLPYMETKKPEQLQHKIDRYEKMKNEIIQRGLLL
jgi:hypothetical protein